MDAGTLVSILLPFLALVAIAVAALAFVSRRMESMARRFEQTDLVGTPGEEGQRAMGTSSESPWWGSPLLWLGLGAMFLFLGLVVSPKLFGGVILFLPFIWVGGRRRRRGTRLWQPPREG